MNENKCPHCGCEIRSDWEPLSIDDKRECPSHEDDATYDELIARMEEKLTCIAEHNNLFDKCMKQGRDCLIHLAIKKRLLDECKAIDEKLDRMSENFPATNNEDLDTIMVK